MVRLRQRKRFQTGGKKDEGPASAPEKTAAGETEDSPRVEFRRTPAIRGDRLPSRSVIWLAVLLLLVLTAIIILG